MRIALSAQPQASLVPLVYGVDHNGADFDLPLSVDKNVTIFDSHTTAAQTVLAGKAQVMGSSVASILDAREQGADLKIFCPYVSMDDFVLAGAHGVNTVGQLFEPSTRVGIDSPGGAGAIILNALLRGVGETRDTEDIPTQQIVESSSARAAEWGAGNIDATVIHENQCERPKGAVNQPVRIVTLHEKRRHLHQGSSGRQGGLARPESRTRRQVLRHHTAGDERDERTEGQLRPIPIRGQAIRQGSTRRRLIEGAVRTHRQVSVLD